MDAKQIAKKVKLKGLQRLRWYCQMCEKQCRDQNGFKNHCASDGHLREMQKFSSNQNQYVEQFSQQFEKTFMDALQKHHTKRVNANYVYNEMIQDKNHVHLNSTRWGSLSGFCRYLGEAGKCIVDHDEDEDKYFIQWIDPTAAEREQKAKKRQEEDAKRAKRLVELSFQQIDATKQASSSSVAQEETTIAAEEEDTLSAPVFLPAATTTSSNQIKKKKPKLDIFNTSQEEQEEISPTPVPTKVAHIDNTSCWLMPEIVVRICSKKVGNGEFVDEKAVVVDVWDNCADLIVLKSGVEIAQVEAKRLETVIPKPGFLVTVVNPKSSIRGSKGKVVSLEKEGVNVQFENSKVILFPVDDVCKTFEQEE